MPVVTHQRATETRRPWATGHGSADSNEGGFLMATQLKTKFERIPLELFSQGRYELIDELYAPTYVDHTPMPNVPGTRDGLKPLVQALRTAFPDLHYTVDDAIETGDRIVHRLTASGTMRGDFAGMPATGKYATWKEIHIGRVADGRVVEHWGLIDQLDMLIQLGVIPAPGRAPVTV